MGMKISMAVRILLAVAIVIWIPVAFDMSGWGGDMWHLAYLLAGVPQRTILTFHQFPFWNPYAAGGEPLLAYPMSNFLSPSFLLPLAFGPVAGPKLRILLSLWVGMCGSYLLGRKLSPGRYAPFICSFLYMLSSWYPLYMSHWHDEFIPFAYIPWLLLFYRMGMENRRWCALGGVVMAIMILEGGVYAVPYALVFLTLYALLEAAVQRKFSPLVPLFLIVALGVAVSAMKLFPLLDFVSRYPRPTYWREPVLPLRAIPRMFFGRDQLSETNFAGAWLGWWEYGAYLGLVPLILAFAAPFLVRRRAVPVTVLAALFFLLTFGDYGALSPWRWLHTLPPFSSMHDPVRFRIILVLCLAIMSAMTVSWLESYSQSIKRRPGSVVRVLLGILTVAFLVDLMLVSAPIYSRVSIRAPLESGRHGPFRQKRLPKEDQQGPLSFLCFLQNEGLINNYDPMYLPSTAVAAYDDAGYRGEVWLEKGAGTVDTLYWSPNRVTYELKIKGPDVLLVNQRYDPGWRATDGRKVSSRRGIIAVKVGPSDTEVTLFYRPPFFLAGLLVSVAGIAGSILVWRCYTSRTPARSH
jgi:hypothetical protein